MLDQLEKTILNALQTVFDQFGWAGVFVLMAFENATGITPSELILTFSGWMLIAAHNLPPLVILLGGLVAALGSTAGSSLAYWAARKGGRPLVNRLARLARIDSEHITTAETQFQRWGVGAVFLGRMIPGVRTLISIPAGLARMPFPTFVAATLAGTYIWCTLLIGAGYLLGHEWMLVSSLVKQALPYLLAAGLLAIGGYIYWRIRAQEPVLAPARVESKKE